MKRFRNKNTGVIYETSNDIVADQYEKHPELYEAVKEKEPKKAEKAPKNEK